MKSREQIAALRAALGDVLEAFQNEWVPERAYAKVQAAKATYKATAPKCGRRRRGSIVAESLAACECWEGCNDREGKRPCIHERLIAGGTFTANSGKKGMCRCGAIGPPWLHRSSCRHD